MGGWEVSGSGSGKIFKCAGRGTAGGGVQGVPLCGGRLAPSRMLPWHAESTFAAMRSRVCVSPAGCAGDLYEQASCRKLWQDTRSKLGLLERFPWLFILKHGFDHGFGIWTALTYFTIVSVFWTLFVVYAIVFCYWLLAAQHMDL